MKIKKTKIKKIIQSLEAEKIKGQNNNESLKAGETKG